jgi:hypothetical protein
VADPFDGAVPLDREPRRQLDVPVESTWAGGGADPGEGVEIADLDGLRPLRTQRGGDLCGQFGLSGDQEAGHGRPLDGVGR